MPAPLEIPVMVYVMPSNSNCSDAPFGVVSVVIIPVAAAPQASARKLFNAGCKPFNKRSNGNCSPITPVENGNTSVACTPASSANFAQVRSAFSMPVLPVPALALPVLIMR